MWGGSCQLILFCILYGVCGDVIWVNSTSNSTTGCGDIQMPCGTLSAGVTAACALNSSFATVWVETGSYDISSPIKISCNIKIRSTNSTAVPELSFTHASSRIQSSMNFTLKGFTLTSQGSSNKIFLFRNSEYINFENINIQSVIKVDSIIHTTNVNSIRLRNFTVENCDSYMSLFDINNSTTFDSDNISISNSNFTTMLNFEETENLFLTNWEVINTKSIFEVIHCALNSTLYLENSTFNNVSTSDQRGSVFMNLTAVTITNCTFEMISGYQKLFMVTGNITFNDVQVQKVQFSRLLVEFASTDYQHGIFTNCEFIECPLMTDAVSLPYEGKVEVQGLRIVSSSFFSFFSSDTTNARLEIQDILVMGCNLNRVVEMAGQGSLSVTGGEFTENLFRLQSADVTPGIFILRAKLPHISTVEMYNTYFSNSTSTSLSVTKASTIINNMTMISNSHNGYLLDFQQLHVTISNFVAQHNSIFRVLNVENSKITLGDSKISENTLYEDGLQFYTSNATFHNVTLSDNTLVVKRNSVIDIRFSEIEMDDSVIENNSGGLTFLFSYSSSVSIASSVFRNNFGSLGGAFQGIDCNLNIYDSVFEHCHASLRGGAMLISGSSTGIISGTNITGLDAQSRPYFDCVAGNQGGGLFVSGNNTVLFDNILLERNYATTGGCVLTSDRSKSNFQNSKFSYCNASTSGGAIVIGDHSTPIFTNCEISKNFAESTGSGIMVREFSAPIFDSLLISENISPNTGAGMYLQDSSNTILTNVVFSHNFAESGAAAMMATFNSIAIATNCIFQSNICGSKGGALGIESRSNFTLQNSIFRDNIANSGGAVYVTDFTHPELYNCSFINNTATSKGGAIYGSNRAKLQISNSTFDSNIAQNGIGGAILILDFAFADIEFSMFTNNNATYGGAIYVSGNYSIDAIGCNFIHNYGSISGGGIVLAAASVSNWRNCSCSYNRAINADGGCLYTQDDAIGTFSNCNFTQNKAEQGGAARVSGNSQISSTFCVFSDNEATSGGGGILVGSSSGWKDFYSLIENNFASQYGGGVYISSNEVNLKGTELSGNIGYVGGALFVSYQNNFSASFTDLVITDNIALHLGGGIAMNILSNSNRQNHSMFTPMEKQMFSMGIKEVTPPFINFQNTTIRRNRAEFGGAIFIDSLQDSTPTFDLCLFLDNKAIYFGGAIVFQQYNKALPIITNAFFVNNSAIYGGSNVAFDEILIPGDAANFCKNCSLTNDNFTTGYQNSQGFASGPSFLGFNSSNNQCPSSVLLDEGEIIISVFLYDTFGTIVSGKFLQDSPMLVHMLNSSEIISTDNFTQLIDSNTGGAFFNNTRFCGPNNSTVNLEFDSSHNISPVSCSILLFGCSENFEVSDQLSDGCATCSPIKISKSWIITITLFGIVILLCLIVAFSFSSFFAWKYWKKVQKDRFDAMEIPDFSERPSLTLDDILNDPAIPRLPWEEVTIEKTIGKGASGLVSRGIWCKKNGKKTEVAMKELLFGFQDFGIEVLEEFLLEIKFMSAMEHKNIVKFIGICIPPDNSKLYLITELMHYGSIRDLLDKKGENLNFSMRLKFAIETAKGMKYLHGKKLIHRDLKSENLLVNKSWTCKVADFGISTVRPTITREMTCIGTPVYMAPEVLTKNKYSEKADVFSFGILLHEIFSGQRPYSDGDFKNMNQAQLMYAILESESRPTLQNFIPALQQIIEDCWNVDPQLRPSFSESIIRLQRLNGKSKKQKENLETEDSQVKLAEDIPDNLVFVHTSSEYEEFDSESQDSPFPTARTPLIN